jgi:GTPase involved in cell partitioning and DNA repair
MDELTNYGNGLDTKPRLLVINKIDLPQDPSVEALLEAVANHPAYLGLFHLSCLDNTGFDALRKSLNTLPCFEEN